MTQPSSGRVWLRGRFTTWDGQPVRGRIRVAATPAYGVDRGPDGAVLVAPADVSTDRDGRFAVPLPPVDDPDIVPTGYTYVITGPGRHGPTYPFSVPSTVPVVTDPDDALFGKRVLELRTVLPAPAPQPGTVQIIETGGGAGGPTTQLRAPGTASVALSGHRLVTPSPSGLVYADNRTAGHAAAPLWLTTGAAAQGTPVSAVAAGPVTEPSWSWTPGPVWLGQNGVLTQTPPAAPAVFSAQVGYATTPTTVVIDRAPSIELA